MLPLKVLHSLGLILGPPAANDRYSALHVAVPRSPPS